MPTGPTPLRPSATGYKNSHDCSSWLLNGYRSVDIVFPAIWASALLCYAKTALMRRLIFFLRLLPVVFSILSAMSLKMSSTTPEPVDHKIYPVLRVVVAEGRGLVVIDVEALLIVSRLSSARLSLSLGLSILSTSSSSGTSSPTTAWEVGAAFAQQFLEGPACGMVRWEAVENDPLFFSLPHSFSSTSSRMLIIRSSGTPLTLGNVFLGDFPSFGFAVIWSREHFPVEIVVKAEFIDESGALGSFPTSGAPNKTKLSIFRIFNVSVRMLPWSLLEFGFEAAYGRHFRAILRSQTSVNL